MADWTFTWYPQLANTTYDWGTQYRTLKSTFESGKEQRRQKWTTPKHHFKLAFNADSSTTIEAIRAHFESNNGSYTAFYYPNYVQSITGTRLACVEGGAGKDTITDSSSGFVTAGFADTQEVWIYGSGAGNNGHYSLYSVAAGTLTLDADEDLAAESANASLAVYRTYYVRYVEDRFMVEYVTHNVGRLMTLELIEVI